MMKGVAIVSGGMDSATLLHQLMADGWELEALSFDYGQRHRIELVYAECYARQLGIEHRVVDMSGLAQLLPGNSQTDPSVPVPHGHYAEESMKLTVVPNRNMIMLSIAVARAIALRADVVAYGAHSGDHAIYPDCRPEFVAAMHGAVRLADWHSVGVVTPFLAMDKTQICSRGAELGVDFKATWTCYDPVYGEPIPGYRGAGDRTADSESRSQTAVHCGFCGACTERREAFVNAGVADPTHYAHD